MKETEDEQLIILNMQDDEVARHSVVHGRNQRIFVAAHYEGLRSNSRPVRRPTAIQVSLPESRAGLPIAPQVEARPLSWYDQTLEVLE